MALLNLVHESKIHSIEEDKVWKKLLQHRWDVEILKTNSCLNDGQVLQVIYKTGQDLNVINGSNIWNWFSDNNLAFGIQHYAAIHYCPEYLIEAAKLSKLFESLITNENLNTVVAATMHNIQPRAGDNIKDFTAINMWYQRLDERYNFSLGPNILPLMTTDDLTQLEALDPPFLRNYNDAQSNNVSALIGNAINYPLFLMILVCRRRLNPSGSPTSLDIGLELCIHSILRLQD